MTTRHLVLNVLEYLGELDTYYPQLRKNKGTKEPLQKVVSVTQESGLAIMMYAHNSIIAALRPRYCVILYSTEPIPVGKIMVELIRNVHYTNLYYNPLPAHPSKEDTMSEILAIKDQIDHLTSKVEELYKKL